MDLEQIDRIVKSCNFKYKQQVSNMKKKIKDDNYKSILQKAFSEEIKYLNEIIKKQNMLLGLDRGEIIIYKS